MKKTNFIWILAAFLLVLPMAFADSPIIDSLSPANNSIFFESPIILNVTATDPDEDPLNYSFHILPGIYMDNGDWADASVQGTSWASYNSYSMSLCPSETKSSDRDIIINQDSLIVNFQGAAQYSGQMTPKIFIDGDLIYAAAEIPNSGYTWNNYGYLTLDTSSYNDGEPHNIAFGCRKSGAAGCRGCQVRWWFPQFTNETATTEEKDGAVSNGTDSNASIGDISTLFDNDLGNGETNLLLKGWWVKVFDNESESNTSDILNLQYASFYNCSSASNNIALNFTFRDEENQSAINGGLTTDFTLSTDLSNLSYGEDLSDADTTNIYLCLDPSNVEVNLEWPSFVEYQPTDTGSYGYKRFYYFANSTISGDNTQDIGLFNLEDSLSSETTFTMQKEGQNVAQGLIQVLRYYAAEQTSKVVAMKKTNTNGQATERVRQGDALYNILGYDENLALCYATPTAEELGSTLSIYCDISGVTSNYWPLWLLYHYVSYDFAYNNATNVTTLTWAGVTGAPTQARFRVTKLGGASESTICDSTSSSTSGTLDCTLTDLNAIYNLEFIAKLTYGATTGYFILASEFLELKQNLSDLIGKDGTFLAIFIIGLLAFTGLFNPAAAVLLATLGVVITSLMGLIPLGLGALVAIVLTGGIIAVKMRT